jgi:hypothetical protein
LLRYIEVELELLILVVSLLLLRANLYLASLRQTLHTYVNHRGSSRMLRALRDDSNCYTDFRRRRTLPWNTRAESAITVNHAVCVATPLVSSHDTRVSFTLFFILANVFATASLPTPYFIVALTGCGARTEARVSRRTNSPS